MTEMSLEALDLGGCELMWGEDGVEDDMTKADVGVVNVSPHVGKVGGQWTYICKKCRWW